MESEPSVVPGPSSRDTGAAVDGGDGAGVHGSAQRGLLRPWSDREEVGTLPEILRPAEVLVAVGSGTVVRSGRLAQSRWLVVVTDRRLLCIKGRDPVTRKVIDMPISQIRGVEVKGLIRKTLSLDTGFGTLRIGSLDKSTAAEIARELTRLMGAYDEDGNLRPTPRTPRQEPEPPGHASRETPSATAGPGDEEPADVEGALATLDERVGELTERVAFLEELVRSNAAADPYDEEKS